MILSNDHTGISVSGHETVLSEGVSTSLNCTTDLAVDTIEWLDAKGAVLANGTSDLLELMLPQTNTESIEYTCRIRSNFGVQNKTVTLTVLSAPLDIQTAVSAVVVVILLVILLLAIVVIVILVK